MNSCDCRDWQEACNFDKSYIIEGKCLIDRRLCCVCLFCKVTQNRAELQDFMQKSCNSAFYFVTLQQTLGTRAPSPASVAGEGVRVLQQVKGGAGALSPLRDHTGRHLQRGHRGTLQAPVKGISCVLRAHQRLTARPLAGCNRGGGVIAADRGRC